MKCILCAVLLLHVQVVFPYKRFHHDYHLTRADMPGSLRTSIQEVVQFNEDMPEYCRTDVCRAHTTFNERKGLMVWPDIPIGEEIELRCPFSFDIPVYTTRVCSLNGSSVYWTNPNLEKVCPDPPLATLIKQLDIEEREMGKNFSSHAYQMGVLARMVSCLREYRDTPINKHDVRNELDHLFKMTRVVVDEAEDVPATVVEDILFVMNTLLDNDLRWKLETAFMNLSSFRLRFKSLLNTLALKVNATQLSDTLYYNHTSSHISLLTVLISTNTHDIIDITSGFQQEKCPQNVNLYLGNIVTEIPIRLGLVILKEGNAFRHDYTWQHSDMNDIEAMHPKRNTAIPSSGFSDSHSLFTAVNSTITSTQLYTFGSNDVTGDRTGSDHSVAVTVSPSENINLIKSFHVIGHLLLLSTSPEHQEVVEKNIGVTYKYHKCPDGLKNNYGCSELLECVKSTSKSDYSQWSGSGCALAPTEPGSCQTCHCAGLGAFGVFVDTTQPHKGIVVASTTKKPETQVTDISAFLGFPYNKELEILGIILGVISLICLVITIASYAAFRNTRRGSPTTILLNLCVAMIVLYVLLILVQIVGTITIPMCTAANVFRYYLVFVTLLWNGVEAVNMYLMLVKVFNSQVSKFALKAGLVAWGVPALMVAVGFAINTRAFKGQYVKVETKEMCVFKCILRTNTLYYGYLIPLGIIILHNLIVFGLVLRILMKHNTGFGKSQKKTRILQLVGAVATLVLLGVPWMFSAFGAIDATKSTELAMMEGIFQVIFVVFVNLQGLFIFIFHCARNEQVRLSWVSMVSTARFSLSNSSKNTLSSSSKNSHRSCRDSINGSFHKDEGDVKELVDLKNVVFADDCSWHTDGELSEHATADPGF